LGIHQLDKNWFCTQYYPAAATVQALIIKGQWPAYSLQTGHYNKSRRFTTDLEGRKIITAYGYRVDDRKGEVLNHSFE